MTTRPLTRTSTGATVQREAQPDSGPPGQGVPHDHDDVDPHGVPSWIDLATPDPSGSKAFYGSSFGWEFRDDPTDQPEMDYTMATLDGRSAAGMM